jgi:hypothetical protein
MTGRQGERETGRERKGNTKQKNDHSVKMISDKNQVVLHFK